MKLTNYLVLILLTLTAQCFGLVTSEQAKEQEKKRIAAIKPVLPTPAYWPTDNERELIDAIKQNDHQALVKLVREYGITPENTKIPVVEYALEQLKETNDLFALFHLLANGFPFTKADLEVVKENVRPIRATDRILSDNMIIDLEYVADLDRDKGDKRTYLNFAISAAYPFLTRHGATPEDIKQLKEMTDSTYSEPVEPIQYDEELEDWVFMRSQEETNAEQEAKFKKLIAKEGEDPDEWEFVK